MNHPSSPPEKFRLRRSFDRAARTYDHAAALQREVLSRALERLALVRIVPAVIVDAGCGTGAAGPELARRFPRSTVVGLDLSPRMLFAARSRVPWWQGRLAPGRRRFVCGDFEQLPLRSGSAGLIWSNLAFQWAHDLSRVFAECHRALQPGGLLMFTSLGPDTLKELRHAFAGDARHAHVNEFADMHDIGDMLVQAGFADPVMDMETLTLTYAEVRSLMRDLKDTGAHNVNAGRNHALTGRGVMRDLERRYEAFRREGRLPATFEVVYGHAWKPQPRVGAGGRAVIDLKPG